MVFRTVYQLIIKCGSHNTPRHVQGGLIATVYLDYNPNYPVLLSNNNHLLYVRITNPASIFRHNSAIKEITICEDVSTLTSYSLHPSGEWCIIGFDDGSIQLIDVYNGNCLNKWNDLSDNRSATKYIQYLNDNQFVVFHNDKAVLYQNDLFRQIELPICLDNDYFHLFKHRHPHCYKDYKFIQNLSQRIRNNAQIVINLAMELFNTPIDLLKQGQRNSTLTLAKAHFQQLENLANAHGKFYYDFLIDNNVEYCNDGEVIAKSFDGNIIIAETYQNMRIRIEKTADGTEKRMVADELLVVDYKGFSDERLQELLDVLQRNGLDNTAVKREGKFRIVVNLTASTTPSERYDIQLMDRVLKNIREQGFKCSCNVIMGHVAADHASSKQLSIDSLQNISNKLCWFTKNGIKRRTMLTKLPPKQQRKPIKIALLDSGLSDNDLLPDYMKVSQSINCVDGGADDLLLGDLDPKGLDLNGHGTEVAGITGAYHFGLFSGQPNTVKLINTKCACEKYGKAFYTMNWLMRALEKLLLPETETDELVDPHEYLIINICMSWDDSPIDKDDVDIVFEPILTAFCAYAWKKEMTMIVLSAGNNNCNLDELALGQFIREQEEYKSNFVVVASCDKDGDKSDTSSYGSSTVSLYAPGENIFTTTKEGNGECKNVWVYENKTLAHISGNIKNVSGTSCSTPLVSACLAYQKIVHPLWNNTDLLASICDDGSKHSDGQRRLQVNILPSDAPWNPDYRNQYDNYQDEMEEVDVVKSGFADSQPSPVSVNFNRSPIFVRQTGLQSTATQVCIAESI